MCVAPELPPVFKKEMEILLNLTVLYFPLGQNSKSFEYDAGLGQYI